MEMVLWNAGLTGLIAFIGYVMKEKSDELQRVGMLLNKTREEVARDHITRAEVREDMRQLIDRLEKLDHKIDKLIANAK
jgi:hypothetical protein